MRVDTVDNMLVMCIIYHKNDPSSGMAEEFYSNFMKSHFEIYRFLFGLNITKVIKLRKSCTLPRGTPSFSSCEPKPSTINRFLQHILHSWQSTLKSACSNIDIMMQFCLTVNINMIEPVLDDRAALTYRSSLKSVFASRCAVAFSLWEVASLLEFSIGETSHQNFQMNLTTDESIPKKNSLLFPILTSEFPRSVPSLIEIALLVPIYHICYFQWYAHDCCVAQLE